MNIKHRIVVGSFFAAFALSAFATAQADLVVLFDGNGLPSSQPWLAYGANSLTPTQTPQAGGVRLQSDLASSAGYSNYVFPNILKNNAFPTLSRSAGFELAFSLAVNSENHTSGDRAGFSVILLGDDAKGIELGFWGNRIWAQQSTPIFTQGEGVATNTSIRQDYRLRITDNNYNLFAGANSILSGDVRDYTLFANPPYTQSNFLFLGDNTTSGAADITLGPVTLQTDITAVPEASSLWLIAIAIALYFGARLLRVACIQSVTLLRTTGATVSSIV